MIPSSRIALLHALGVAAVIAVSAALPLAALALALAAVATGALVLAPANVGRRLVPLVTALSVLAAITGAQYVAPFFG